MFVRGSLLVLVWYISLVLNNYVALSFPGISVYISRRTASEAFILGSVLWLGFSPLRKACCTGRWTEVLFNLFPVNMLALLVFSQRHLAASAGLLILFLCLLFLFAMLMGYDCRKEQPALEPGRHRRVFARFAVLAFSGCCTIPWLLVTFYYGVSTAEYTSSQSWLDSEMEESEEEDDPYAANISLLTCFQEDAWKNYTVQEQTDLIQEFVCFECSLLGIPEVPVTVSMLDDYTLGLYNDETNEISVSVEYLDLYSAEETMETICHETYHAYQFFCVDNTDWDSAISSTVYFDELRSWQENSENYISPSMAGYDAYASQPLEASAREYAEEEVERLLPYIYGENEDL